MMGMQVAPAQLFYDFCLDDHVPDDHLLRRIDRFLDLESVRSALRPFYSSIGRPSVDPEVMMRMLVIGYCMDLRSERRLCEEVHLNLACRCFCRFGLDGKLPEHSTFSRNRMAASAKATSCATCSRAWSSGVWQKGWSVVKGSPLMPA
jgi:transposase